MSPALFAGIETGGTHVRWRVEDEAGALRGEGALSTGAPEATVQAAAKAILAVAGPGRIAAAGLAAFGPIEVDPASPRFGRLRATPKPGWSGFDLRGALASALDAPVALDTDVNAAALAEQAVGAGRGLDVVAYVTVGTGIGGGLAIRGGTLKGALHPEIGHLRMQRLPGDARTSTCPFHADCAEGLAAGPALRARLGPDRRLEADAELFGWTTAYLAQLCEALVLAWSPQRIVLGGGVMETPGLRAAAHAALGERMAGYGPSETVSAPGYLAAPGAPISSGLAGAMLLARG